MHLTAACLFRRTVNGFIFGGKHRLPHKIRMSDVNRVRERFADEERIMTLLRNPYLTQAESSGHAKALNKRDQWMSAKVAARQQQGMRPGITIEQRLYHLTHGDKWE